MKKSLVTTTPSTNCSTLNVERPGTNALADVTVGVGVDVGEGDGLGAGFSGVRVAVTTAGVGGTEVASTVGTDAVALASHATVNMPTNPVISNRCRTFKCKCTV